MCIRMTAKGSAKLIPDLKIDEPEHFLPRKNTEGTDAVHVRQVNKIFIVRARLVQAAVFGSYHLRLFNFQI